MSNLNSAFDTLRGWPNGSALEFSFRPKKGVTLKEGTVVTGKSRQLEDAVVLDLVDDSLATAPTLSNSDKGKAYHITGNGGGWSSFSAGDIVEWNGSAWVLVLANSGGEPPDGTRAVVSANPGTGSSFASDAKKTVVFTAGAPGSWSVAETPEDDNRIYITSGVYGDTYFDYHGVYPAGNWRRAVDQKPAAAVMDVLSSSVMAGNQKDDAWLVIQGNDQFDAMFVNKITCLKLQSGCVFKVQNDSADSLTAGTFVEAASGSIQALTDKWPIGVVVWSNGLTGTDGQIAVASM